MSAIWLKGTPSTDFGCVGAAQVVVAATGEDEAETVTEATIKAATRVTSKRTLCFILLRFLSCEGAKSQKYQLMQ
jgi:hypothetical protein